LVSGALLAALAAWTVGMMPFLRASILIEARFIALDLTAIGLFALLIALRAGAFARVRGALARPNAKAGATYAAMHLVALAEARAAQPTIHKEATS
jgi:hypothetical protein